MKKITLLFLALIMCVSLCACGGANENTAKKCEQLIEEIGSISTYGNISAQGEVMVDSDGIKAYEKAKNCYDSLSDKEKKKVKNIQLLEDMKADYEEAKADEIRYTREREILLACKDAVVEEIKDILINSSSYEEINWNGFVGTEYDEDTGAFFCTISIEYSATNALGGRVDQKKMSTINGIYKDGNVSDLKITLL